MSSFTGMIGMFRSLGFMPWYWTPASEIEVVRLCAIDPIAAARTWMTGFCLMIKSVVMVIWYSTKVRLHNTWRHLRRGKNNFALKNEYEALRMKGLSSDIVHTEEWQHYTDNLSRNIGRKLFLTDTGYVGLGPCHMEVDNDIIVIPGGSVPHVLRSQAASYAGDHGQDSQAISSWSYVGEVYCDGIMDGELVAAKDKATRSFEII
ncbi:hypothetical protein HD806DRAFT_487023 [Xylariaceae sp. AK1471]|nr:hypothetical protein HD806DRAFT_487023 [Xylariaceae sp. AK1471]